MVKVKIVLAANEIHYTRWCRNNGIIPHGKEAFYARGVPRLHGLCFCEDCAEVITLPEAYLNRNYQEVRDYINQGKKAGHRG